MSAHVRQQAIQPHSSFLVQAPAGSGKTELLAQRILALLGVVQEPEEILALTFTKKAAAEMRDRVLEALRMPKPSDPNSHKMATWTLASQAMQQSQVRGWNLLENPNRLKLVTLDSLTHSLAKDLPLLSGLGVMPSPSENPQALYQQAAEISLQQASKKYQSYVETLLLHQDHNTVAVINMMADMLSNREQWLPNIMQFSHDLDGLRQLIENNLRTYLEHQLSRCDDLMPIHCKLALSKLMPFAAEHGGNSDWANINAWPKANINELHIWTMLSDFILTASDAQVRKSVTKTQGFPPECKEEKQAALSIFADIAEHEELVSLLHDIRQFPAEARIEDQQWLVLEALFTLLPLAVAELQEQFMAQGAADYTEISLRALQALSDEYDNPSDILLSLDYRIQHLLVDEFQDTSELQIRLLKCLTAGWQNDDGRTLFMVGDPMQSIYRFRKADVGLFLQAADNQLALPDVTALSLIRNFRSAPSIVNWVNQAFAQIFPSIPDAIGGAVIHAKAEAAREEQGGVHLHLFEETNDNGEADAIVEQIIAARTQKQRIGILAASRKHLHAIMPALEKANIPFRAVKILPLNTRPEVRLLRALTRALLHPADDQAWLAILRAPCCGLSAAEMGLFLQLKSKQQTIPSWLQDPACMTSLDTSTQSRLTHIIGALTPCLTLVGQIHVRPLLETAWQRLAMPHLLDAQSSSNVETVLSLLENLEAEHLAGFIPFNLLDQRLEKLYAAPDNSPEAEYIELMTMHGAKGLQWDVVILPGMGKTANNNQANLLAFTEASHHGQALFLMAPKAAIRSQDAFFSFIQSIEKSKQRHEQARLLYVACTRAETALHMFGHTNKKGEATKGSLLHLILNHSEHAFGATLHHLEARHHDDLKSTSALQRMATIPAAHPTLATSSSEQTVGYVWAGAEAAPIGNTIHAMLQRIAEAGIEHWHLDVQQSETLMRRLLIGEGLSGELLEHALKRCKTGLHKTLNSQHAKYILSSQHQNAHCEWAISHISNTGVHHYVIDRSFEDADGIQWIIDYKTASHEGSDLEGFLEEEYQRHHGQLEQYALVMRGMGYHNLRLALYFPMLDAWREWDANGNTSKEQI